jgi:hypothetical protein
MTGKSTDSSNRVETLIGTTTFDTPKRISNPVTGETERIDQLSEDGYKRRFLALLHESGRPSVVDLDNSPVATFDKDKWDLEESEGRYYLVKSDHSIKMEVGE